MKLKLKLYYAEFKNEDNDDNIVFKAADFTAAAEWVKLEAKRFNTKVTLLKEIQNVRLEEQ